MPTVIVLLNRDLRVSDHPALAEACREATEAIPLFVVDDASTARARPAETRAAFLATALRELREALRSRGGDLVIRRGDPGFPLIDAGMRQLRTEGWMPNRVKDARGIVPHETSRYRLAPWCRALL
ncbi:MAG: deoxyribodipyrimidine photo-lyase [Gaiellaceae bacterium]